MKICNKEVFDVDTGLWNFSPTSHNKQTVSDDPFDAKLTENIRIRSSSENLQFYPDLIGERCPILVVYVVILIVYSNISWQLIIHRRILLRKSHILEMLSKCFIQFFAIVGNQPCIRHLFQFCHQSLVCEYGPQNMSHYLPDIELCKYLFQ